MTVGELIERLKEFDPEDAILVDGYEEGYDDVKKFKKIFYRPSKRGAMYSWIGDFEEGREDDEDTAPGIILSRKEW